MKQCTKCRREWPDHANFCPMDGALLESAVPAPTPAPAPTPTPTPAAVASPAAAAALPPVERERLQQLRTEVPAARPAAAEARPAAAQGAPSRGQKLGQFSETQWFMAALDPEKLEDIAPQSADKAAPRYAKTEAVPTDVRAKFSLSDTFVGPSPVPAEAVPAQPPQSPKAKKS